jgi:hypothetical protein
VLAIAGAVLALVALEGFGWFERRFLWPRGVGRPPQAERED